jgi:hypothetical protein
VIFSHVLYQLSYLGAGPRETRRESEVPRVIKARLRSVQNGAGLTI